MILHDNASPEHTGLVIPFRTDDAEQATALDGYVRAFGAGATHVEELDEKTSVLHVYAGVCAHGDAT
jgi:hypothetical protein